MSHESEHSENEFYYPDELSHIQNYFSRQLTPKAMKEIQHSSQKKKLTTFSEAKKQEGGQGNNFSR